MGCRLCLFWLCFVLFGCRHGMGVYVYGLSRVCVGMGAYACVPKYGRAGAQVNMCVDAASVEGM